MTKLFIERDRYRHIIQFYIQHQFPHKTVNVHLEDGKLIETELDNSFALAQTVKPFLELPYLFGEMFMDLLIEEVKHSGITPKQENIMQGKLEATEKHLNSTQENFDRLLTAFMNVTVNLK